MLTHLWGKTVVFDSSTLINFLRIDRLDLLLPLIPDPAVTDVVRGEISDRFQCSLLENALSAGQFREITLSTPEELTAVRDFINEGLGRGESASIVAAHTLQVPLAVDDILAAKRARKAHPKQIILNTRGMMLAAIDASLLSIAQADEIKETWQKHHRFALPFKSFSDHLTE